MPQPRNTAPVPAPEYYALPHPRNTLRLPKVSNAGHSSSQVKKPIHCHSPKTLPQTYG